MGTVSAPLLEANLFKAEPVNVFRFHQLAKSCVWLAHVVGESPDDAAQSSWNDFDAVFVLHGAVVSGRP